MHCEGQMKIAAHIYDMLYRLLQVAEKAVVVQKAYRSHHGKNLLAEARHQVALHKQTEAYRWWRSNNHVKDVWDKFQFEEAEAKAAAHAAWLKAEQKRIVLLELEQGGVLRFGWREEPSSWDENIAVYRRYEIQKVERDETEVVHKGTDAVEVMVEETLQLPLYDYEHEMAARVLGRAGRSFLARMFIYLSQRRLAREQQEAKERLAWEERQRLADQLVTVSFDLVTVSADVYWSGKVGLSRQESADEDADPLLPREDGHLPLWKGFLLEACTGAKGSGGEKIFRPAQITCVNVGAATVTTSGIKKYPKGTFGVWFEDNGEEVPDVSRRDLRVLHLVKGVRVQARYQGTDEFYPGTVTDINQRDGKALSYCIEYDDGDVERFVKRGNIRADVSGIVTSFAEKAEAKRRRDSRRRSMARRVGEREAQWEARKRALAIEHASGDEGEGEDEGKAELGEDGLDRDRVRGPQVGVKVSISFTRAATKYGWSQERGRKGRQGWWVCEATGERSKHRPYHSFQEDLAAKKLQSVWRMRQGRREFASQLAQEDPLLLATQCIHAASQRAWVGHGMEGVTVVQWLLRCGVVPELAGQAQAKAAGLVRGLQGKGRGKTSESSRAVTDLWRIMAAGKEEEVLIKLGIGGVDLKRLCSVVRGEQDQPVLLNYYTGPTDVRSCSDAIAGGRAAMESVVGAAFPENKARVEAMVAKLTGSRYPVTRMQLEAWLARHEGKPRVAQGALEEEVLQAATVPSPDQEEEAFNVFLHCTRRLPALLSNLKLAALKAMVESALLAVEVSDLKRRPAGAALLLRREALKRVVDWSHAAIAVQVCYRGHKARRRVAVLVAKRCKAAVMLQCAYRQRAAHQLYQSLAAQKASRWEELWDDENHRSYFHNLDSLETSWDEPGAPYRPLVRDKFTQRLVQAWPMLDIEKEQQREAEPGFCMRCKEEKATRMCNECSHKDLKSWSRGKWHYCFACYAERHAERVELRSHTFTLTSDGGDVRLPPLTCSNCGELATRRCLGIALPAAVLEEVDKKIALARLQQRGENRKGGAQQGDSLVTREGFLDFLVDECKLPFSSSRVQALYTDCLGEGTSRRSPVEFWLVCKRELREGQDNCDDVLCAACWQLIHKRGQRAKHRWMGFQAGAEVCVCCAKHAAERRCGVCEDALCAGCFKETHASGKRRNHPWSLVMEEGLEEENAVGCESCSRRLATERCDACGAQLCDSCCAFEHPKACPARGAAEEGDEEVLLECSVCGKVPTKMCRQCQVVYCEHTWIGNEGGCFGKDHMKGQRRFHTTEPYTKAQEGLAIIAEKKQREKEKRALLRRSHEIAAGWEATSKKMRKKEKKLREKRLFKAATKEFISKTAPAGRSLFSLTLTSRVKMPKLVWGSSRRSHTYSCNEYSNADDDSCSDSSGPEKAL
ncbi:unnamed protein product [Chrysoparadoxa australica]